MNIGKAEPFTGNGKVLKKRDNKRFEEINFDHLQMKEWIIDEKLFHVSEGDLSKKHTDVAKINMLKSEMFTFTKIREHDLDPIFEGIKNNEYVIKYTIDDKTYGKLYFDKEDHLLLRSIEVRESNCGRSEKITQYKNYKNIDGIKLPTYIKYSPNASTSIEKTINYSLNVEIDDSIFEPKK
jgi:hypothetical protein